MVLPGITMTVLTAFAVALIGSGVAGSKKYRYHIPWACSVLHESGELIGACAILEINKVLVSVSAFQALIEDPHYPPTHYFRNVSQIQVWAGTNYMNPAKKFAKPPTYAQMRIASKFYVPYKVPTNFYENWDFRLNPNKITAADGAEFDPFGLAFDIGILVFAQPFVTSAYLLPMIIKGPNIKDNTKNFITEHEMPNAPSDTCITYSWNQKLNRIQYHKVMYVKKKYCREAYCYWKISNCSEFPKRDHLLCFKSVKYVDLCPNARGAALYCYRGGGNNIAILTAAPSCGQRNLPGVYTTLPLAINFFEKIYNIKFDVEHRRQYEIFALDQKNSDYEGIP